MKRTELEHWIAQHPDSIHADARTLLDRCETKTRDHAQRDAWIHAKEIAQESLRRFEHGFGYPASDAFVAREVCHQIALELKRHEPIVDAESLNREDWINQSLLNSLDSDSRVMFLDWLNELAVQEEHSTWREIVRFTDHRARHLIRERHMTDQCDWDIHHGYPVVAARIVKMLISEFEAHAAFGQGHASDTAGMH